jgi:hypothetical protein
MCGCGGSFVPAVYPHPLSSDSFSRDALCGRDATARAD